MDARQGLRLDIQRGNQLLPAQRSSISSRAAVSACTEYIVRILICPAGQRIARFGHRAGGGLAGRKLARGPTCFDRVRGLALRCLPDMLTERFRREANKSWRSVESSVG